MSPASNNSVNKSGGKTAAQSKMYVSIDFYNSTSREFILIFL
jgi:hypothetical protein